MARTARRRPVPQASQISLPAENEIHNAETLADHIASYRGAPTARELSEILSISAVTVFKPAKRGTLPSFRVGSCVRFCARTIADWLREGGGWFRRLMQPHKLNIISGDLIRQSWRLVVRNV
jgi:hypothetical protein